MTPIRLALLALLLCLAVPIGGYGGDLDELLSRVRQEGKTMSQIDREREARFLEKRVEQADRLARAKRELAELESQNRELRDRYRDNQEKLSDLEQTLDERTRDLQTIFQAARQSGAELAEILSSSLVSAQLPGRAEPLKPFVEESGPLTLKDLKALWYLLLQEMVETGKVAAFQGQVIGRDGVSRQAELIRVGTFNMAQDGRFLRYEEGRLYELARQPSLPLQQTARAFADTRGDLGPAVVDPGRGAALEILGQTPDLWQRLRQGGVIGYLILGLGGLGLMIGIWRVLDTALISRRMRRQLNDPGQPTSDNPLGRVLLAGQRLKEQDPAHLELHLQEAALREIPRLTLAQSFLKLLAAVAPLLGLLGTVTGMILTFQAITLAGSANSSLMAEGIGQALVTTVLGLIIAIPILFLHNFLASRSRSLIQVLDQETAGLIVQAAREGGQ